MGTAYLTADEIIQSLEQGIQFGANHMSENMLRRTIERIRNKQDRLEESNLEGLALQKMIRRGLSLFQKDKVEQLLACEIYVLPYPICIAHSRLMGQRKIIVIGNGMLDLLYAMANWAQVTETLPVELDSIFPFTDWPNVSATSGFAVFTFILIYRYYQFGECLPDFKALLQSKDKKWVQNGMESAVLFLLFHEVGHHSLEHLTSDEIRPMIAHSIIDEELSNYQKKELEADWFVYQSLSPETRKVFQTFMIMGLNFHSLYENLLSVGGQEHPLTLNRLYHAQQNIEEGLFDKKLLDIDAHLASQATSFENIRKHNNSQGGGFNARFLKECSIDKIREYLGTLSPDFKKFGLDINSLYQEKSPQWQDVLTIVDDG